MRSYLWLLCAATVLICLLFCSACGHQEIRTQPLPSVKISAEEMPHFVEIARQSGIDFKHNNGARGKKYMPETVGSGVAFLDYDNDGWQDILIVNSSNWPEDKEKDHSKQSGSVRAGRNIMNPVDTARPDTLHLYHNNRNGTFTDVTREAGLDIEMYGMGVAIGDFDNDGYEDIYTTAIGANHLFRNTLGDKKRAVSSNDPNARGKVSIFQDVTVSAGVPGVPMPGVEMKWKWSASAAWLDYDKDGKLDLFVCQYVKWSPALNKWCGHNGKRGYCPPGTYEGSYCTLYHNEGNGHFRDVSKEMGISKFALGKSFGIAVADYNGDGWPDIAVTNDTWANYLFINDHGKFFKDMGVEAGIATGESGHFKAGMGIDVADWRNDGRFALLTGNFAGESLSLLEQDSKSGKDLLYTDNAQPTGLAEPSLTFLTFGLFFFDYDLDGWQDIFTANGHVDDIVSTYDSMLSFKERPLLYHNQQNGTFAEVGTPSGLTAQVVGRGAAYGDIDNDGDPEIALVNNGGQFHLYRNERKNGNHWVRFRLEGVKSNRDGLGTLIRVKSKGRTQSQYVHSGGSFLSENQRQITFGLGPQDHADEVEIIWPSGIIDHARSIKANQQYLITEGQSVQEDARIHTSEVNKK